MREAGIEIILRKTDVDKALVKKIKKLREDGLSYQRIADLFNLWKLETNSGKNEWYAKAVCRVLEN